MEKRKRKGCGKAVKDVGFRKGRFWKDVFKNNLKVFSNVF